MSANSHRAYTEFQYCIRITSKEYATFVHSHTALITWSVDVDALIPNTQKICSLILQYLWQVPPKNLFAEEMGGDNTASANNKDIEAGKIATRPIGLMSPLHVGLACGINILVCCNTIGKYINAVTRAHSLILFPRHTDP